METDRGLRQFSSKSWFFSRPIYYRASSGRKCCVSNNPRKQKTVRIKLCTGIGDDWAVPYWGIETTIDKQYAVDKIRNRERLEEFFRKRARRRKLYNG